MISSANLSRPYVGVSGVISPEQQAQLETGAREAGLFDTNRVLALGVKAVHKTQFLDVENKYGREWYPVGAEDFSAALRPDRTNPDTIAVAQTYLDVAHVGDDAYRRYFTSQIMHRGSPWLQGIQFDMLPWHRDTEMFGFLEALKDIYGVRVFLQCHDEAMTELGPKGVVQRLGQYATVADYLLFDASHGTGKRLDTARLDPFLDAASSSEELRLTKLAVAGGLNETVVREDLPVLCEKYPDLSWDAEGQLHPVNAKGKRPLDMRVVDSYIKASVETITAVKS